MMEKEYFDFEGCRYERLRNKINRQDNEKKFKRYPRQNMALAGDIFSLENKLFNIPKEKGMRHPGAVIDPRNSVARVSKGTDERNILETYRHCYIEVIPDSENHLEKITLFSKTFYVIRIKMFGSDYYIGKLSNGDYEKFFAPKSSIESSSFYKMEEIKPEDWMTKEAFHKLTDIKKEIFKDVYINGFNAHDIFEKYGMDRSTYKKQLHDITTVLNNEDSSNE